MTIPIVAPGFSSQYCDHISIEFPGGGEDGGGPLGGGADGGGEFGVGEEKIGGKVVVTVGLTPSNSPMGK